MFYFPEEPSLISFQWWLLFWLMAREFSKSFYNSKEWKETRAYVLKRDNYLCVKCGAPAAEVHHKEHLSESNIGDTAITMNPKNLISLCKDCHFAEHKGEHAGGRKAQEESEYTFDENGFLIPKALLPPVCSQN